MLGCCPPKSIGSGGMPGFSAELAAARLARVADSDGVFVRRSQCVACSIVTVSFRRSMNGCWGDPREFYRVRVPGAATSTGPRPDDLWGSLHPAQPGRSWGGLNRPGRGVCHIGWNALTAGFLTD